jgi:hypothetical protein
MITPTDICDEITSRMRDCRAVECIYTHERAVIKVTYRKSVYIQLGIPYNPEQSFALASLDVDNFECDFRNNCFRTDTNYDQDEFESLVKYLRSIAD